MSGRLVITGANSAVGRAILRRASRQTSPAPIVAAVRSDRAAAELPPGIEPARISYENASSLDAAFTGASGVIHLAGVLVERPGSTYEQANVNTTRAVAGAAARQGLDKLVFVSVVGADAASSNRYWKSKGEAEAVVRTCGCAYTILRVPLLLGPGTEGTAAMRRHLSRTTVILPGGGRNRHQPLHIDDLARAALLAAEPALARNRSLDLVGPVSMPDRDILEHGARLLGRAIRIRSMPIAALRLALAVRRRMGGPGFSPDVLEVITADTQIDPAPAAAEIGIALTGLDDMIREIEPLSAGAS
jgi:NADH dehydrogenase